MNSAIENKQYSFMQIHIEAARNSTDDFNLFHDKNKWQRISGNPFGGPIVLGFQLECLVEYLIRNYRIHKHETLILHDQHLNFSNYQFTFANVVHPNEPVSVEIKKSRYKPHEPSVLANRIVMKSDQGIVLTGFKRETRDPYYLSEVDLSKLPDLNAIKDRTYVPGTPYFLKRKYFNTGNAKNFLSGSLAEQADYFDELEDKVRFPEIFPVSMASCALLEMLRLRHHNFEKSPMVYTSHHISVNRQCLASIRSNNVLNILIHEVRKPKTHELNDRQHVYHCFGLTGHAQVLFRAEISLMDLADILKSSSRKQSA